MGWATFVQKEKKTSDRLKTFIYCEPLIHFLTLQSHCDFKKMLFNFKIFHSEMIMGNVLISRLEKNLSSIALLQKTKFSPFL